MTDDAPDESIFRQLVDSVIAVLNRKQKPRHVVADEKSACPPYKKRKPRKRCERREKIEDKVDVTPPVDKEPPVKRKPLYPEKISYCYIKMQNPYAPCCCEPKPKKPVEELPPCPPKGRRQPPRRPTCECDLCKRNMNHRCCRMTATGMTCDAGCFEEA